MQGVGYPRRKTPLPHIFMSFWVCLLGGSDFCVSLMTGSLGS